MVKKQDNVIICLTWELLYCLACKQLMIITSWHEKHLIKRAKINFVDITFVNGPNTSINKF